RQVGVIRWRDEFFALRNICPHQYGPVCRGYTMLKIVTRPDDVGTMDVDDDTLVLTCPWHGWEFDVRTGRAAWADVPARLRTFAVQVENGRVLIDVKRRPT